MDEMDWWAVALIVPVLWAYYVCRWQFLFAIETDNERKGQLGRYDDHTD